MDFTGTAPAIEPDYGVLAAQIAAEYHEPHSTITDEAHLLKGILFALLALAEDVIVIREGS